MMSLKYCRPRSVSSEGMVDLFISIQCELKCLTQAKFLRADREWKSMRPQMVQNRRVSIRGATSSFESIGSRTEVGQNQRRGRSVVRFSARVGSRIVAQRPLPVNDRPKML